MPGAAEDEVAHGPKKKFSDESRFHQKWVGNLQELDWGGDYGVYWKRIWVKYPKKTGNLTYKNIFSFLYCVRTILQLVFSSLWLPDGWAPKSKGMGVHLTISFRQTTARSVNHTWSPGLTKLLKVCHKRKIISL